MRIALLETRVASARARFRLLLDHTQPIVFFRHLGIDDAFDCSEHKQI
jgi:hypothetical protein